VVVFHQIVDGRSCIPEAWFRGIGPQSRNPLPEEAAALSSMIQPHTRLAEEEGDFVVVVRVVVVKAQTVPLSCMGGRSSFPIVTPFSLSSSVYFLPHFYIFPYNAENLGSSTKARHWMVLAFPFSTLRHLVIKHYTSAPSLAFLSIRVEECTCPQAFELLPMGRLRLKFGVIASYYLAPTFNSLHKLSQCRPEVPHKGPRSPPARSMIPAMHRHLRHHRLITRTPLSGTVVADQKSRRAA
jgi:hypothetical protein